MAVDALDQRGDLLACQVLFPCGLHCELVPLLRHLDRLLHRIVELVRLFSILKLIVRLKLWHVFHHLANLLNQTFSVTLYYHCLEPQRSPGLRPLSMNRLSCHKPPCRSIQEAAKDQPGTCREEHVHGRL
ncbi:hypothetical protein HYQ46_001062 [Verticillium longisporum]|nr:hypothetical protein HYQ46_001062 [Verticillium longisporum]